MKLLLVAMPSIHFFRWVNNIPTHIFDLYWFNIKGGKVSSPDKFLKTFVYNKRRKLGHIKGEYTLSKHLPGAYEKVRPFLEVTEDEVLQDIITELEPNLVHSFEMQSCSYSILKTMCRNEHIKWIYSCWGSDLYFYKQFAYHQKMITKALRRIDYMFTDSQRDYHLAKALNFTGAHLGVFPGGGGYNLDKLHQYILPVEKRNVILVKGYQHNFGRALNVIKALEQITDQLKPYQIVVFGSHIQVVNYIEEKKLGFKTYHRHQLQHEDVIKLMGRSLIYIGNSISDGIPNTLLEAVCMGAFPIQSNPGNVSEEVIESHKNGLLINNPEDVTQIKNTILAAINSKERLKRAFNSNLQWAKYKLDNKVVRQKTHEAYAATIKNTH